ncbi:PDZ and LIM domain protein Zasp [Aphelenchoides bicaudatus]|nr:PDZ and LIM domain protein Zasp [Aphelenchoides bicaudatus]
MLISEGTVKMATNPPYDVVTIRMSRSELTMPWGFSIRPPSTIQNVEGGSLADKAGLRNGDLVDELQFERNPAYERLHGLMESARHELNIIVLRDRVENYPTRLIEPVEMAARIWKPSVNYGKIPDPLDSFGQQTGNYNNNNNVRVSLQHQPLQDQKIYGFNQAPRQFGNTPVAKFDPNAPAYLRSEALKLIQETEKTPIQINNNVPPECFACGRMIIGLMCNAFDKNLHPDCFQCSTCGSSLAQQGHHFINDKFYCDVHGKQRSVQAPTPPLKSVNNAVHGPTVTKNPPRQFNNATNTYQNPENVVQPNSRYGQALTSSNNTSRQPVAMKTIPQQQNHANNFAAAFNRTKVPNNNFHQQPPIQPIQQQPPIQPFSNPPQDSQRQHGQLFNSGSQPRCEHCGKEINGSFVLATGKTWCPEHFTCANVACNRRLLDCGFVEESGKKYCEKCFETLIAPICAKCGLPITADCLNALQKQWHPECFVCVHCRQTFGNTAFYLENGQPYCEKDWNQLFTTKCVSCKFPIEAGDRWIEAIGSSFHSNCFNCFSCQVNLEGQNFYARDGHPFCRAHA